MNEDAYSKDKTRSPKGKLRGRCPACGAWVTLRDAAEVWDVVDCPECATSLEIVELRPPTLEYARDDPHADEWSEDDEETW